MKRERISARESSPSAARVRLLEERLRDEAPSALTPAPPALRSRILGRIWETTPERGPALGRLGRPILGAAALLALTAGAMLALSTLTARPARPAPTGQPAPSGAALAIFSLLDEARALPSRVPGGIAVIPGGATVGAEAERMLADARRAAQRFGERLLPVRAAFLGEPEAGAEGETTPPGPEAPPERRPG